MAKISEIIKELRILKKEVKKSILSRKRIYTLIEASIVAGVSLSYIQKLISSNQIPYSKPTGKLIFIRRRDLESFLMKNYVNSNDEIESQVANFMINHRNSN